MRQMVPNESEMRRYLRRGLTQQQIVEAWEADSGIKVSRAAIGMAISRYGLESSRPRPRYEDTMPWKVQPEHQNNHNARMLRLEGRRRRGLPLSEEEQRWVSNWLRNLKAADAVIVYLPGVAEPEGPFVWVERNEWDTDIVRMELDNTPDRKGVRVRTA